MTANDGSDFAKVPQCRILGVACSEWLLRHATATSEIEANNEIHEATPACNCSTHNPVIDSGVLVEPPA